jgi:hypothetical protein
VWRELRDELHPAGFELLTVSLDSTGGRWSRRWIEAAAPTHPSLVDVDHLLDRLFGVTNVPSGIWIDESGVVVRPPETAFPGRPAYLDQPAVPDSDDPYVRESLAESRKIRADYRRYPAALRDWVAQGAESRFALAPGQAAGRAGERTPEAARAAAHFELGRHLLGLDDQQRAVVHFREAHRLQPLNWTYKRQAWSLADRRQGPTELYDGDWLGDVKRYGAENYYPRLDL